MSCPRYYTHSVVTYNSLDCCFDLFNASKHYCYIIHDRDKTDEHIHVLCTFDVQRSIKAVRNLVVGEQNTFSQECKDVEALLEYWTHDNEPDKEPYPRSSIQYDDEKYWKKRIKDVDDAEDKNVMFINDLLDDKMTLAFMAKKYGRDFIRNVKAYMNFRKLLKAEEKYQRKGDDYESIYFDSF